MHVTFKKGERRQLDSVRRTQIVSLIIVVGTLKRTGISLGPKLSETWSEAACYCP